MLLLAKESTNRVHACSPRARIPSSKPLSVEPELALSGWDDGVFTMASAELSFDLVGNYFAALVAPKETFGNNFVISLSRLEVVPLLNPSFNAQPQAPACSVPARSIVPAPAAGR